MLKNCVTSDLVLQIKDNLKSGCQSKSPYYILYSLERAIRKVQHFEMSKWSLENVRANNFLHKLFCSTNEEMCIILLGVEKSEVAIKGFLNFEAILLEHKNCESLENIRVNQFYTNRFACSFFRLYFHTS